MDSKSQCYSKSGGRRGQAFITSSIYVIQQAPDLYQINTSNTGTHKTEIHILDAKNNYSTHKLDVGTALQEVDPNDWRFIIGDYNGDGIADLFAITKNHSGSGRTEVHVYNGSDNFQTSLLDIATSIELSPGSEYNFDLADFNGDDHLDLYAIKRANTGSNSTEVHILNGANQPPLLDTATPLGQTGPDDSWEFHVGDINNDGHPDVYGIFKTAGPGKTELHILDGASNYTKWLQETATVLGVTGSDSTWNFGLDDYNYDGTIDLYALYKPEPSIHIINGKNSQNYFYESILPTSNSNGDHSVTFLLPK